jgi:hypothetical protein
MGARASRIQHLDDTLGKDVEIPTARAMEEPGQLQLVPREAAKMKDGPFLQRSRRDC